MIAVYGPVKKWHSQEINFTSIEIESGTGRVEILNLALRNKRLKQTLLLSKISFPNFSLHFFFTAFFFAPRKDIIYIAGNSRERAHKASLVVFVLARLSRFLCCPFPLDTVEEHATQIRENFSWLLRAFPSDTETTCTAL
jgi:hypothetical protein